MNQGFAPEIEGQADIPIQSGYLVNESHKKIEIYESLLIGFHFVPIGTFFTSGVTSAAQFNTYRGGEKILGSAHGRKDVHTSFPRERLFKNANFNLGVERQFVIKITEMAQFRDPGEFVKHVGIKFRHSQDALRLSGCHEVLNECFENILIPSEKDELQICKNDCPVDKTLRDGKIRSFEAYFQHKEGYRLPVFMRTMPIMDSDQKIVGAVETFYDTSPKVLIPQKAQELKKMNLLDPLTEMGNKSYLEAQIMFKLEENGACSSPPV